MKQHVIRLLAHYEDKESPSEQLTMKPFLDFVKRSRVKATGHRKKVLSWILKKCTQYTGIEQSIALADINKYTDVLQMVYATTSPILEEEHLHYWALAMPVSPIVFYSTDAFFNTIADTNTGKIKFNFAYSNDGQLQRRHQESYYSLILRRCYNIDSLFQQEIIYPFEGEPNGLIRYFKISFDDRFIEVKCKDDLPPFPLEMNNHDPDHMFDILQKQIPLELFCFQGMTLMTVSEVSVQYAVENIKNLLTNASTFTIEHTPLVINSLKTLVRSKDIEFGLFPLLMLNNKHIFNHDDCINSLLLKTFEEKGTGRTAYRFFDEKYLHDPKLVLFKEIPSADSGSYVHVNILKTEQIQSYALIPIYYNTVLCGVLEMYSWQGGVITEDVLPKVEPALPFIAQIFQKNINDFDRKIEAVIKKHFTAVQPAVQWKFNEAAWHYIRRKQLDPTKKHLDPIVFEQVYPLYGAIDVRNSTAERNRALLKDLKVEFELLREVLNELKSRSGFGLIDEKIFQCNKWLEKINEPGEFTEENNVNAFLDNEIAPFLIDITTWNGSYAAIVNRYFDAVNELDGSANAHRRQLEQSMKTVIDGVNDYMEMMKDEMQQAYPCYFEKFRTDGVEYDVYIGQSIAPEKPFKEIYLNNLRLMQLASMAALAKYTHSLIEQLVRPIETTQLIFINAHPIDIKFRIDEKRFDVEGAYNIRYHIVKKRIDKVYIKNTRERLTIPNKIALVYFNQKEADEYAGYIHYLQGKGVLMNDLEYLELEQLQGISGLKAMRVGVVLD
jgi:hypothetical protein